MREDDRIEDVLEAAEEAADAKRDAERKTKMYNIAIITLGVMAVCVGGLLIASLFDFISPDPSPPPVGEADIWERVEESGTLIVGTSADYPPFAYYTSDYQIDGFDMAVIRELGKRLGVEVEVKDMAFEGLLGALQIQQIDLAIAAISSTPERETVVDFSNPYFVSEDAILANKGAPALVGVTSIDQLAGYRVGVQQSTLYERWLMEELVDTGKTAVTNIHLYNQADQAVTALSNGELDFVVLDLPPATLATNAMNVLLVGSGLNRQRFAIAMGAGQSEMQKRVNTVLVEMQNEGVISAFASQYMGIDPGDIAPIPTPDPNVPTATPLPTATAFPCVDGMEYVDDLNLDDNNMTSPPQLQPGQPFQKGWRIKNTGTCTWNSSYNLVFSHGNVPEAQMGGQPTPIVGEVQPGAMYDIYVQLTAPFTPGVYQSFWTMKNQTGLLFGNRIWVGIEVPGPATPTPAPTQTPSPNINFTVDRARITAGECVNFSWNVTNAKATYFYQQGQPWQSYPVAPVSSSQECPPVQTTYELRVVKMDDSVEVRQIVIYVDPLTGAPIIERFTVDPANIYAGQCVDIRWQVSGEVNTINIYRGSNIVLQNAPLSGTRQDCPTEIGTVTYRIEATGSGGTSQLSRNVNVTQPSTPVPSPTVVPTSQPTPVPTAQPPVIYNFTVTPATISESECVTVNWSAGGGADAVRILRNGNLILSGGALDGSAPDCLNSAGGYTYRLEAYSNGGQTATAEQVVTVNPATTVLPLVGTPWQLKYYYDGMGASVSVLAGTEITAVFDNSNNLSGSAGCNTYTANYSAINDTMNVSNVGLTAIACGTPVGIMEQEAAYTSNLPLTTHYKIMGNILQLIQLQNGIEIVLMEYEAPQATPY